MTTRKKEKTDLLAYIREGRTMTRREKLNLIIQLSIPSMLAQLSTIVMFFIDASMVAHLGAKASASIGLIESTSWLFGGLASACSMGFSVQVAHAIGANDFDRARHILRQGITCCLIFSACLATTGIVIHRALPYWLGGTADIASDSSLYFLIFACAAPLFQLEHLFGSMLKCSGNMKVPSMLNIMMCFLDVIFNSIFIFILGFGVAGAAMGTSCAYLVTTSLMGYFLIFRSDILHLKGRRGSFRPTISTVKAAFGIGAPMGLQHLLMGGAQIVSTMIVAPLGTIAIAAHSLAITVESLCYMPGYGIGEAAATLVGQSTGAGRKNLVHHFSRMTAWTGIGVMTVTGILMYFLAPLMMLSLSPDPAVQALGTKVLRIEVFAEPMYAASIVASGALRGAGDTMIPSILNFISLWFVRIPLSWILAKPFGLTGVWIAMCLELICRGILMLIRLLKKL